MYLGETLRKFLIFDNYNSSIYFDTGIFGCQKLFTWKTFLLNVNINNKEIERATMIV